MRKAASTLAGDVAADLYRNKEPDLKGEIDDLVKAVTEKRVTDVPRELSEAALAGQVAFAKSTGTNLPLFAAELGLSGRRRRKTAWQSEFSRYRLPYSEDYLRSGSDFGDPAQVKAAFLAAGKVIDDQEALQISLRMTGQYGDQEKSSSAPHLVKMQSIVHRAAPLLGDQIVKAADFNQDLKRVIDREGKIGVTTDLPSDTRGGATQAGIAQSYFGKNPDGSWKKSKAQIAALTPAEIKNIYADIYKVPNRFRDPRVREVLFDMTTNAGPKANRILQESVNQLVPAARRIKVDGNIGTGTLAAAEALDQGQLANKMLDGYSAHHQALLKSQPGIYGENKDGWANRVRDLRAHVQAVPAPAAARPQPVLVKGKLSSNAVLVRPQQPRQPAAPAAVTPPQPSARPFSPGGPIPSIPLLSAPPTGSAMGKQASYYHMLGADDLEKQSFATLARLGHRAAVGVGLKPGFRDMLRIRRGINVTQDLADGGVRAMNGRRGMLPESLSPISPGANGVYDNASKQVRLVAGADRNTLRHELQHAYQFEGKGLMRRMADWRSAPGAQNTLRGSIGNAAIEAQAQMAGNRGVMKGLREWGRVAPLYTKYYNASGAAAMPYQASHMLGNGIAAAPAVARGLGYGAAGTTAGVAGLAMLGSAGQAGAPTTQQGFNPQPGATPFQDYMDAPQTPFPGQMKMASLSAHLRRARNRTHTHPTPAQASAGNYAKGSLILHGMHVKLENPKGTERRGYDKDGNVTWRRTMEADYGYFAGTKAIDGDAVDCFIGDDPESNFVVAIDQQRSDGSFDETKFVLGCATQAQAEKLYLAHYPRGWKLGPVSTTTVQQLKAWLKEGDTKSPFKGQMVKAAKDYGKLLRNLRLRRGECPVCAKPNQDPYPPCGCDPDDEPRSREKEAKSRYGTPDFEARIQAENAAFDRAVDQMPEGKDKEMAKKGHGTAKGSCGCRIRGCRCPSRMHNISLTLDIPCKDCNPNAKTD